MKKKQWRLKYFICVFLLAIFVIPIGVTKIIITSYESNQMEKKNRDNVNGITWIKDVVLDEYDKWEDKSWQQHVLQLAKEKNTQISLRSPQGNTLFSNIKLAGEYPSYRIDGESSYKYSYYEVRHVEIFNKGEHIGTLYVRDMNKPLFSETSWFDEWGPMLCIIIIVSIIIIIMSLFIQNNILKPLSSLNKAALLIAQEEFSFSIEQSSIQEMNSVLTSFKGMAEELSRLRKQRMNIEKERQFFVSSIVHDLRTPIFSIRGYLEGINKGVANTPEKLQRYLHICINKSELLEKLVANLSRYSNILQSISIRKIEEIDLTELFTSILEDTHLDIQNKHITVNHMFNGQVIVHGDSLLLHRSFENIISNAIRYTPIGGIIELQVVREMDMVKVCITDSGEGIAEEDLPYIFEPLYRAEKSRNRNTAGLGLGLAIVEKIMTEHKGTVRAYNHREKGAVFEVVLPHSLYKQDIS
ncbi:TPA: HAMP domain-containing histidine kinase [Bacillus pseudomycoides]|nr:HAMP domain-containing histidine kinase [Bacillus pseudomycoides]